MYYYQLVQLSERKPPKLFNKSKNNKYYLEEKQTAFKTAKNSIMLLVMTSVLIHAGCDAFNLHYNQAEKGPTNHEISSSYKSRP